MSTDQQRPAPMPQHIVAVSLAFDELAPICPRSFHERYDSPTKDLRAVFLSPVQGFATRLPCLYPRPCRQLCRRPCPNCSSHFCHPLRATAQPASMNTSCIILPKQCDSKSHNSSSQSPSLHAEIAAKPHCRCHLERPICATIRRADNQKIPQTTFEVTPPSGAQCLEPRLQTHSILGALLASGVLCVGETPPARSSMTQHLPTAHASTRNNRDTTPRTLSKHNPP